MDVSKLLWGNDVILREVTSYLTITDLKQLSSVNKYLLERVRTLYRFTSLVSQKVTGEMKIHVFKLSRAIVEVNKLDRETLHEKSSNIFQETVHLELVGLKKLSSDEINSRLIQIVSHCPRLKSLKLETLNTLKDDKASFLRDENVKTVLANLTELHIGYTSHIYDHYPTWGSEQIKNESSQNVTYKLFEKITENMNLVKFTYSEPSEPSKLDNDLQPVVFLNNSMESLKELNLDIQIEQAEALNGWKFPKLIKLELSVIKWCKPSVYHLERENPDENFPKHILPFLRNHLPNLTEFQFGANDRFYLAPICGLLREPVFNKKLKKLGFKSLSGFTGREPKIDWSFLKTMSNLQDIKLIYLKNSVSRDDRDDFYYFLSVLPSNIKSIYFHGSNFWQSNTDLLSPKSSELLRFKHLTRLEIYCRKILNDALMQFICKNLTHLKILRGDFFHVTFFGISGVNRDKNISTGYSIANFKDLVELEINTFTVMKKLNCSVKELIALLNLSHLEKLSVQQKYTEYSMQNKLKFTGGQFLRLLSQNPCLEYINLWGMRRPNYIRSKVLKLHPRFKWQGNSNADED